MCSGLPANLDTRCTFDVVCAPNEGFVQKQNTQIYLHVEFLHIEVPNPLIRNFKHACLCFAAALRIVRAGETIIFQLTFTRRDLPEWIQRWSSCASNSDIIARATSDIAFLRSSVKLFRLQHSSCRRSSAFRVEVAEDVVSRVQILPHSNIRTTRRRSQKNTGQSHQRHLGRDVPEPTTNKQLYVNHKRLRRDAFVVVVVVVGP